MSIFYCFELFANLCMIVFRFLKNLQIIVSTVLQSIPALGSIVMLISLVLCIHTRSSHMIVT